MKNIILVLALLPLLLSAQNDSSNYVTKHKMATISFALLFSPKSVMSENPQYQFGLIFKNIIKGGTGLYILGNKERFIDEFTAEYEQLERTKNVISYRQYEINKKQLDERKEKGATITFLNLGFNHNFYYHSKVPLVLNLGANIISIGGTHGQSTKGSVNLDAGFSLFLPSKNRFEAGLIGDFSFYKVKTVKYYFGVCLGFKV